MKVVERLLAQASGRRKVEVGEIVVANVDRLIMHDQSAFMTGHVFEEQVDRKVRNPERVWIVFDHNFAPANRTQAEVLKFNRDWARKHGFNLADCGSGQIHNVIARLAGITPGMVVVGSDSHTAVHGTMGAFATGLGNNSHAGTVLPFSKAWFRVPKTALIKVDGSLGPGVTARDVTLWLTGAIGEGNAHYLALEFGGDYFESLSFWDRWLFPLIAVDLGAKSAFVRPDEVTAAFLSRRGSEWSDNPDFSLTERTPMADYETIWEFDVGDLVPQVACPPTVGNVVPVTQVAGTPINWAELGGHGGGRIEDIRLLAGVFENRRKHPDVHLNIVPDSRETFAQALSEGLVGPLHEAGATWFPPSTGSNQAVNMGAMASDETMLSTQSRNFPGRNGHPDAKTYIASALTVAASAITGQITDPHEFIAGKG